MAPNTIGKYTVINNAERMHIINAHKNGFSPALIAFFFGFKTRTVCSIIKKFTETGEHRRYILKAGIPQKLGEEEIERIRSWLAEDNTLTLKRLTERVLEEMGLTVSTSAMSKIRKMILSLTSSNLSKR